MRHILHDWADSYCVKILRQLRDAAGPSTRLFDMDKVMPYACHPDAAVTELAGSIPGTIKPKLKAPLTNVISGSNLALGASLLVSYTLEIFLRRSYAHNLIIHADDDALPRTGAYA